MTQRDRVLRALRQAGATGIDQTQFEPPVVIDGGPPILRLAARIDDLKADGYAIGTAAARRHKCVVYLLAAEPSPRVTPPALTHGFVRRHVCRKCLGTVAHAAEACGSSYAVLCPPEQVINGCLKPEERELRNAA